MKNKLLKLMGATIILLALLDCITAFIDPRTLLTEMNPLVPFIKSVPLLILIKLVAFTTLVILFNIKKQAHQIAYYTLLIVSIYMIIFHIQAIDSNIKAITKPPSKEVIKEINKVTTYSVIMNIKDQQYQVTPKITMKKKTMLYLKEIYKFFSPMIIGIGAFVIFYITYKRKDFNWDKKKRNN